MHLFKLITNEHRHAGSVLVARDETPAATDRFAGIAGGTLGGVTVLIIIGICLFARRQRRKRDQLENMQQGDDARFNERDTDLLPGDSAVALHLSKDWDRTSFSLTSGSRKSLRQERADSIMEKQSIPPERTASQKSSLGSIPEESRRQSAVSMGGKRELGALPSSKEQRTSTRSVDLQNAQSLHLVPERDSMVILPATPRESIMAFSKKGPELSPQTALWPEPQSSVRNDLPRNHKPPNEFQTSSKQLTGWDIEAPAAVHMSAVRQ